MRSMPTEQILARLIAERPICFFQVFSASDLESNRLAGLKAFIWPNLCTRHIPNKLTPRGHEDWPDKRLIRSRHTERGRAATIAAVPTDFVGHGSTLLNSIAIVLLVTPGASG